MLRRSSLDGGATTGPIRSGPTLLQIVTGLAVAVGGAELTLAVVRHRHRVITAHTGIGSVSEPSDCVLDGAEMRAVSRGGKLHPSKILELGAVIGYVLDIRY